MCFNVTFCQCSYDGGNGKHTQLFYVETILGSLVVVINLVTTLMVAFHRQVRTRTNYFMPNLWLNNLILGAAGIHHAIYHKKPELYETNKMTCLLRFSLMILPCIGNTVTILCLTVDRHIALTRPLTYAWMINRKVRYFLTFFIWFVSFSFSFFLHLYSSYTHEACCNLIHVVPRMYLLVLLVVPYYITFLVIIYLYVQLWHRVRQQFYQRTTNQYFSIKKSHIKSISVLGLIILSYGAGMFPFEVVEFVHTTRHPNVAGLDYAMNVSFLLLFVAPIMAPGIYYWRFINFRKMYNEVFKRSVENRLEKQATALGETHEQSASSTLAIFRS